MLTVLKQIFVWWNQQTLGTRIYTFLNGKLVGKDEFGNKYFENKTGTSKAYHPNKKNNDIKKKYNSWKS